MGILDLFTGINGGKAITKTEVIFKSTSKKIEIIFKGILPKIRNNLNNITDLKGPMYNDFKEILIKIKKDSLEKEKEIASYRESIHKLTKGDLFKRLLFNDYLRKILIDDILKALDV